MNIGDNKLVCVAAIAGAFGVKGELKLKSFTAQPEACVGYGPMLDAQGVCVLTPSTHRVMTNFIAVSAAEVKSREAAQALKGTKLFVPRAALPEADEDDFYYADLIGLEVKSTDGKRLGTVKAVHEFGAGDMLEIQPPPSSSSSTSSSASSSAASWFHPFTKQAVPKVDLQAGRIIVKIEPAVMGRDGGVKSETEIDSD